MKQVAGSLRLELAQYRELAAFAQFGSDLDKSTLNQLARGARLVEILKQDQYHPLPVEKQILIIYAATSGVLDDLPVGRCLAFESELFAWIETSRPAVLKTIVEKKALDDELKKQMND